MWCVGTSTGGLDNTGAESTSWLIAPRSPNCIERPMLRSDSIVSAILGSFPLSSVASGSTRVRRKTISGGVLVPRTGLSRAAARSARAVRSRLLSNSACVRANDGRVKS